MKAVLCVSALLMLCIGAMAFVKLDGCIRRVVDIFKAKNSQYLRGRIKKHLQFELDDADIIAGFMVHDEDFYEIGKVFFAGNQKSEKAVTFFYGDDIAKMTRIPYSMYYQYLRCEFEPEEEYPELEDPES
ncbi:unnamed protein product [Heligmosomoides polygyrus]|uniref:DUF4359 domain-containing protein n=1 Tax=Heligmosomoides polygyrus TaxID=6339 RepID=A0A183FHH8_HELPZ|nr:unnamed protein product [Heligmosomoides polygyrus]